MKKLICCILFLAMIILPCYAEIYVLVDEVTKDIKGVAEYNTAQVEVGMELIILQGDYHTDLETVYDFIPGSSYLQFKNGKFKENTIKKNEDKVKKDKKNADKQSGKNKLKVLGLTDDEILVLFGE